MGEVGRGRWGRGGGEGEGEGEEGVPCMLGKAKAVINRRVWGR